MNVLEPSQPQAIVPADTSNLATADRQLSPSPPSSTSPIIPESSAQENVYLSPQDTIREDALTTRTESASSSKIKKKFSELDIRGAMADLDIRKSGKRVGIEDFYIQLDEPHRMFWCPGDVVKGILPLERG
jgi:hypothetical protein